MPVVCDFFQIVGNEPVQITAAVFERDFNTGGRDFGHNSFLMLSVRRLNLPVAVTVNNQVVGSLTPNPSDLWTTQMISLSPGVLRDGNNEFQLQALAGDNFEIRNAVCFFGQAA